MPSIFQKLNSILFLEAETLLDLTYMHQMYAFPKIFKRQINTRKTEKRNRRNAMYPFLSGKGGIPKRA